MWARSLLKEAPAMLVLGHPLPCAHIEHLGAHTVCRAASPDVQPTLVQHASSWDLGKPTRRPPWPQALHCQLLQVHNVRAGLPGIKTQANAILTAARRGCMGQNEGSPAMQAGGGATDRGARQSQGFTWLVESQKTLMMLGSSSSACMHSSQRGQGAGQQ